MVLLRRSRVGWDVRWFQRLGDFGGPAWGRWAHETLGVSTTVHTVVALLGNVGRCRRDVPFTLSRSGSDPLDRVQSRVRSGQNQCSRPGYVCMQSAFSRIGRHEPIQIP